MRYIFLSVFLFPQAIFSQSPAVTVDTVGQAMRISFNSPSQSIQIGTNSGNNISTGLFNTYIGSFSGSNNTIGERNIALGHYAGSNNTTGSSNIHIGVQAGRSNQTGNENVIIGDYAGYTDIDGSNNVIIGDLAAQQAIGSRNVFLGGNAGYNTQGSDKLIIGSSFLQDPLISGDFALDSLTLHGNVHVTGDIIGDISEKQINVNKITGLLGSGYSTIPLNVNDNTALVEIFGVLNATSPMLVRNTIGFEIDTFSINTSCGGTQTGYNAEFPLIIETADATDIAALNQWLANPTPRSLSVIVHDDQSNEQRRFNMFEMIPGSTSPSSGGRTSFTLYHVLPPNNIGHFENAYGDFGSEFSYNSATDKLVEIEGITTHYDFCPTVTVDYSNKIITLEFDYNEGDGLYGWAYGFATGTLNKRVASIIETTDGTTNTETSRENFFEVSPFRYEIIYGLGLHTKLKGRISMRYGCNEPG